VGEVPRDLQPDPTRAWRWGGGADILRVFFGGGGDIGPFVPGEKKGFHFHQLFFLVPCCRPHPLGGGAWVERRERGSHSKRSMEMQSH